MKPSDPIIIRMRSLAREASAQAYAPYSRFMVGAAVLTEDGEVFTGCNVENSSFSLTMCAERGALFQAISKGHRTIRAVVIFTPTELPSPPCGACLQVMCEFGPDAEVFSFCRSGELLHARAGEMLPHAFALNPGIE